MTLVSLISYCYACATQALEHLPQVQQGAKLSALLSPTNGAVLWMQSCNLLAQGLPEQAMLPGTSRAYQAPGQAPLFIIPWVSRLS